MFFHDDYELSFLEKLGLVILLFSLAFSIIGSTIEQKKDLEKKRETIQITE